MKQRAVRGPHGERGIYVGAAAAKIVIFGQPALDDGVISWPGHSGELRHQTYAEKERAWAVR